VHREKNECFGNACGGALLQCTLSAFGGSR
jgi:hypothetical protein